MNKLSGDASWTVDAGKVIEKLDPNAVYRYHNLFFDRLSDIQHMLINRGYDLSLVGLSLIHI